MQWRTKVGFLSVLLFFLSISIAFASFPTVWHFAVKSEDAVLPSEFSDQISSPLLGSKGENPAVDQKLKDESHFISYKAWRYIQTSA